MNRKNKGEYMSDLNLSIIEGRVVKKPEIRNTGNGKTYCIIPIASNTFFKNDDQWQKDTTFINVKCWNNLAENTASKLDKGEQIIVYGKLKFYTFTNSENEKRAYHYILATKIDRYGNKNKRKKSTQFDIENDEVVSITEEVPA